MDERLLVILQNQITFQNLAGIDILNEKNNLALMEGYLFKAIEECVELRKTFPSAFNSVEKNPGNLARPEMLAELADIFLFLANFMIATQLTICEVVQAIEEKQKVNLNTIMRKESTL